MSHIKRLKSVYFYYIPNFLIFAGLVFFLAPFLAVFKDEAWYFYLKVSGITYELDAHSTSNTSVFGQLLNTSIPKIRPVDKNFSLVIEKIGLNAPIIKDVPISDESAYRKALKDGIAHATVSNYPSTEPGNVYLFAHASVDFWELGKFATAFNLLRKLEIGDSVYIFYEGDQYRYEVVNKETLPGWNTYPITRPVLDPTLTLQTCDPPGTTLNRLVVTSVLKQVN